MASFVKQATSMQNAITGIAIGAGATFIKSITEQADALGDTASLLKINVEALQAYRQLAEQNGSSSAAMDRALGFLNKNIGKAGMGSQELVKQFSALGLNIEKLQQQGLDQSFLDVVDSIRAIPSASGQAAAAVALFGRSGQELLDVIRLGSGEIERMRKQLEDVGGIASADTIARLGEINKTIKLLTTQLSVLKIEVLGSFGPALQQWLDNDIFRLRIIAKIFREIRDAAPKFGNWAFGIHGAGAPLPVNQPINPAMTGGRAGFTSIWGSLQQGDALGGGFGQGINTLQMAIPKMLGAANQQSTRINNLIGQMPGFLQTAIGKARGQSLGPFGGLFSGIGGMAAQLAGGPGMLAKQFAQFGAGGGGTRVGPLEALIGGTREAFVASRENMRPKAKDPQQEKIISIESEVRDAVVKIADAVAGGVQLVGAAIGG